MPVRPAHVSRFLIGVLAGFCLAATAAAQTGPPPSSSSPPRQSVTLEQAVQLAFAQNQALRAERLAIQASRADEITAGLKPNPTISFVAEDQPLLHPSDFGSLDYMNDNSVATPSISYTFERGGKRMKRVMVAQDSTHITTQNVQDAERQLRFQVVQAYVGVLLAESNLQFTQTALQDFTQVVDINRRRMESGDISEGDYLKIAIQKLQFQQDVSAAQVALTQSRAALRQLMGYETVTDDFKVVGALRYRPYPVALDALKQQALTDRPDYQAAVSGLKLAQDTETLEYSNRVPDITGELEYQHNTTVAGFGFGLSMPLPIHDRNQGNIAHAKVAVEQATEAEVAVKIGVLTDVVSAYAGLKTSDQVASLYETGYLKQAQQSLDISRYAYEHGATSLLDLLDAERTYRQTELDYRQALANAMISAAQVNYAVGKQVIP